MTPLIHYAATGVYLLCTLSNTARRRRQSTADCEPVRSAQLRHPGYLAALRDAHLHAARLDDITSPLQIYAKRLFGDGANTIYECRVSADNVLLANARITIIQRI
jgi:hypothetical protein